MSKSKGKKHATCEEKVAPAITNNPRPWTSEILGLKCKPTSYLKCQIQE